MLITISGLDMFFIAGTVFTWEKYRGISDVFYWYFYPVRKPPTIAINEELIIRNSFQHNPPHL